MQRSRGIGVDSCAAEFVTPPEISSPPIREISTAELHSSTKDRTCSTRGPASPHQIQEMQGVFVMDAKMKKDQIYKITRRAWFWWTREVGCGDQHQVVVKAGQEYATKDWTLECARSDRRPRSQSGHRSTQNKAMERHSGPSRVRSAPWHQCRAHTGARGVFVGQFVMTFSAQHKCRAKEEHRPLFCGKFCETVP